LRALFSRYEVIPERGFHLYEKASLLVLALDDEHRAADLGPCHFEDVMEERNAKESTAGEKDSSVRFFSLCP
jgi:hypothetical protein